MSDYSIANAWIDMLLIGPRLSWRVIEMAVASARVISKRSRIIARPRKTRSERREYRTMISEKLQGSAEATNAYVVSFSNKGIPIAKDTTAAATKTLDALFSVLNSRSPFAFISAYAHLIAALAKLLIAAPMQIINFIASIFLNSTAPLAQRVTANAKRLSKTKARK